jgi:hypothetical protein
VAALAAVALLIPSNSLPGQDVDLAPAWRTRASTIRSSEIGRLQSTGAYEVQFGVADGAQVQGLFQLLREFRQRGTWLRLPYDHGGAISRSKFRMTRIANLPQPNGDFPAFRTSWSASGETAHEFHFKLSSSFSMSEGNLTTSSVGNAKTASTSSLVYVTFDFNAQRRVLTIWCRDGFSNSAGPQTRRGHYAVTGRTQTINTSERRDIGGGFVAKILEFSYGVESAQNRTLVRSRIGPFPYDVHAGAVRVHSLRTSDGAAELLVDFTGSFNTDCSGTASQYAQVLSGSCGRNGQWKGEVSFSSKSGKVESSSVGRCATQLGVLPINVQWTAPAAKIDSLLRLKVNTNSRGSGTATYSGVYNSALGGCRLVVQADQYRLDEAIKATGVVESDGAINVKF